MRIATIAYQQGRLEAREREDRWTVRLSNLEVRARYLDLALAELLGSAPEAHRAAARLLSQLAEVVEEQESARASIHTPVHRPQRSDATRRRWLTAPLLVGLRVLLIGIVSGTAFVLTTWLSTLR